MDDKNLIQKDLIKKIVGDARGAVGIRLCAIGVNLGIFDNLAKYGSATSEELADRMKLDERYLREWGLGTASLPKSTGKKYYDLVSFNTVKKLKPIILSILFFEIRP